MLSKCGKFHILRNDTSRSKLQVRGKHKYSETGECLLPFEPVQKLFSCPLFSKVIMVKIYNTKILLFCLQKGYLHDLAAMGE